MSHAPEPLFSTAVSLLFQSEYFRGGEKTSFGFLSGLQRLGTSTDQNEQELLPPDQAFKLTVSVRDENTLIAQFEPAKNYYLYKDKVAFKPQATSETSIERISLAQGELKGDLTFGQVEVFHRPFEALISLKRGASSQAIN